MLLLWLYFVRLEHYVGLQPELWGPHWRLIGRILNVGLPAGGEFLMMFVILGVGLLGDPRRSVPQPRRASASAGG